MKLSIVIPTFNGGERLERSLSTLLNQTVPPHEIIVVDDGSTPPIKVPEKIVIKRIERKPEYRGSSSAKNFGAEEATGDWIAFADDDILHMPDAIEQVSKRVDDRVLVNVFTTGLQRNSLDVVGWRPGRRSSMEKLMRHIKITGELLRTHEFTDGGVLKARVSTEQHFGVISKRFFNEIGGYDSASFKSWGYNNQDLCIRVREAGGTVTSDVYRANGDLLYCFHQYSNGEHQDTFVRNREFRDKYGNDYKGIVPRRLNARAV